MAAARQIAFDVLMAVEHGGYAADLLTARTVDLDPRDAGLASSIVLGVLRYQAQLDYLIKLISGRELGKLDSEVLHALRMGVYQLRYLDRVPAHAAVGESVELIRSARKRSATGFANAVLRKVRRDVVKWPDRATELSHPLWMLDRWDAQYGVETTNKIARANLEVPERYVRVPTGEFPPDGAQETEIPGCYRVGDPGRFRIHDIGSQSVVPLLKLRPGLRHLDLCAAPGNKTAQAMESGARVLAGDRSTSRLRPLKELQIPLVLLDAEQGLPFGEVFDRILVDAPCTGTGTLAHNPEIKWRLRPEDIDEMQRRQQRILRNALKALVPGGALVYSTCSLEREENEDVVERTAEVKEKLHRIPGITAGDGFFGALIFREN